MREATLKLKYTKNPNIGYLGPDSMYVVDLYEDSIKVGFIELPNKSKYYAKMPWILFLSPNYITIILKFRIFFF